MTNVYWLYNTPEKLTESRRFADKLEQIVDEFDRRIGPELAAYRAALEAKLIAVAREKPELDAAIKACREDHDRRMEELCK